MDNISPELFKNSKIIYRNIVNQLKKEFNLLSLSDEEKIINEDFNFLIQYSLFNIATNNDTKKISFLEMLFIANIGDINNDDFKYRLDSKLRSNNNFHKKWSYLLFSNRSPSENTIFLFKNKVCEFIIPIKKKIISLIKKNKIKNNSVFAEMIFNFYDLFFKINDRFKKNGKEILINEIKDIFNINISSLIKIKNEF